MSLQQELQEAREKKMAKNSRYRWQNERKRGLLGDAKAKPVKRRRIPGITNKQAAYLASLERQLGRPYSGRGLTVMQARRAIEAARRDLGVSGDRR